MITTTILVVVVVIVLKKQKQVKTIFQINACRLFYVKFVSVIFEFQEHLTYAAIFLKSDEVE